VRRYLVDTSLIAAYLYSRRTAIELISPWIERDEAATSVIVYGEVIEHLKNRPEFDTRRLQLRELLRAIPPYFLTLAITERYADIRRSLRPPHGPGIIGDMDTLIAATALERNLTLITTDSDFERVPGLRVTLIPRRSLDVR
jgi:predicted nucleic acid-binding protein